MSTIEVRGLTKRFGTVIAVDGLDFEVDSGSVVGFLGPNGAGKTTTLRVLLGLVAPTAGTATINGHPYASLPDPVRLVGAALEASACHPGRSARNHLRIHALAGGAGPRDINRALDAVELSDVADRRVGGFSLGMRQRLGLATALLHDPEILILDEPANGLDPEGVRWLRRTLRGLAGEGRTVLVSSHILAEVAQTVDRVIILDRGRLVTQSSLAELAARGRRTVRVRTPESRRLLDALGAREDIDARGVGDWVHVSGATAEEVGLLAARHAIPIFEATTDGADLEDAFLALTNGASGQPIRRGGADQSPEEACR